MGSSKQEWYERVGPGKGGLPQKLEAESEKNMRKKPVGAHPSVGKTSVGAGVFRPDVPGRPVVVYTDATTDRKAAAATLPNRSRPVFDSPTLGYSIPFPNAG